MRRSLAPITQGWLILAALVAIQFLTLSAVAADKLEVDLTPAAIRVRGNAPIPIQAKFRWNGTFILEGHLEVELHEGNQILARYRSGDLALTTGDQSFHMVLPPCPEPYADSQVEAQTKFVTKDQVIDLGYSILFMPTMNERSFVLGWCNAHFASDQLTSAQQSLLFERLAPPAADAARKQLITSVVRLTPEDLPAQPLSYTPYDVMVLTAEGFKEAREGQLHALARWVKGGGSVCVFATGNLHAQHLAFLNELAGSSATGPAFLADAGGNLLPGQKNISCLYSGIGRSVIVTSADPTTDQVAWRQAVAFLWKFRGDQARAIADTGHWGPVTSEPTAEEGMSQLERIRRSNQGNNWRPNMNYGYGQSSYSIQPTQLGPELMQQLMPHTVRLIPFPALAGMLGLFLLMIGPGDFFILGFLRRRRYTWLLFPATSIAFTVATVLMANYYLGLHDQRRSLVVVDLDKDGAAVRWNRYELVFAARDKLAVTELKDALWVPLKSVTEPGMPFNPYAPNAPGFNFPNGNPNYAYAIRNSRRSINERDSGPPWYDGTLPVHFRTSESVHQWQPQLNRIFSFETPPAPMLTNWQTIEQAWPSLEKIQAKLSEFKIHADVCGLYPTNANYFETGPAPILSSTILEELSHGDGTGFQGLVSQLSPNGGGNFEDEQGVDAKAGDSALAIVTRTGDDIVVYRRFFHGK